MKHATVHSAVSRRGTIFHYYLIYLLLTSTLLIVAGICMHTILKADHQDEQISRQLRSLLRIQQALRQDVSLANKASLNGDRLVLQTGSDTETQWKVDQNIVSRDVTQNQSPFATDRFVFRRGTEAAFETGSGLLSLRLTDPPLVRHQTSQKADSPDESVAMGRKAVEVIVPLPAPGGEK